MLKAQQELENSLAEMVQQMQSKENAIELDRKKVAESRGIIAKFDEEIRTVKRKASPEIEAQLPKIVAEILAGKIEKYDNELKS